MTTQEQTSAASESPVREVNVFKGLIWREWLRMHQVILWALAVWLVLFWVLLIGGHPGFVLAFGIVYVLIAAPFFGGGDTLEGSEEFAFSLPPVRGNQYLARLVLGGGTTIAFTGLGVLAVALDLPQHLWGLVVNSGFTEPFPVCEYPMLYGLAIVIPIAAFAATYALAANAKTRGLVPVSSVLGIMLAVAVMGAGFLLEMFLWDRLNGYVSIPALLAAAPMVLLIGYGFYVRKEGVSRPAPVVGGRSSAWGWIAIGVGILLLIMFWNYLSFQMISESEEIPMQDELPSRITTPDAATDRAVELISPSEEADDNDTNASEGEE